MRDRLELVVGALADLVFRFDQDGNFLDFYTTQNQLLAVPPDQIIGRNLKDIFEPHIVADALASIKKSLNEKTETRFEYNLILPEGARVFEARMVPTENNEVISFIRDITDSYDLRKESELKLLEQNKLLESKNIALLKISDEMDSFMYRISHDLRAPLSSILGLAEIGMRSRDLKEAKSCFTMIKDRVMVLDTVIHEILDYAKNLRTDLKFEKINLKLLVFQSIDAMLFNEGVDKIDFQIDVPDELEITSDKERIAIVVNNLISNAIKYHDARKPQRYIRISVNNEPTSVTVHIEDNGQGIAPEYQPNLFTMFFRASEHSKGSGLGLFIAKETLQKLGGKITFVSNLHQGSRFSFSLPQ